MASIYELTEDFIKLMEMAEEAPTEERDIFLDTLEAIEGEIEYKADGYAKIIKNLESDISGLKAEEDRLAQRRKAIENNIKRMKISLQNAMEVTGKEKFKTDLFSFGIQNNPVSVILEETSVTNIPEEYLRYKEPEIDKAKIKDDLKAGKDLNGLAHLEQTRSLRIR